MRLSPKYLIDLLGVEHAHGTSRGISLLAPSSPSAPDPDPKLDPPATEARFAIALRPHSFPKLREVNYGRGTR